MATHQQLAHLDYDPKACMAVLTEREHHLTDNKRVERANSKQACSGPVESG